MAMSSSPEYDLIVLGATGFTGKWTAEHITQNLPTDLNWAIAGRNYKKLAAVIDELKEFNPDRKPPAIEIAELSKEDLERLVRKTRVLITTVGPYHLYGTPVVEACANAGTHYIDCTGETPWIYDVVQKYDKVARSTGAILIPQCGVESAPADIIAFVLASYVRKKYSTGTGHLVHSVQALNGAASGGTLLTAITLVASYSLSQLKKSLKPFALCVDGKKPPVAKESSGWTRKLLGSFYCPDCGLLGDSLLGIQDMTMVYRTWGLLDGGNFYGPMFKYDTGSKMRSRTGAFLFHHGLRLGTILLLLPPVRWLLQKMVKPPGEGPARELQSGHFITWKSVAHPENDASETVVCQAGFSGDMYDLTGKLMAEAAMVLLRPESETWAHKLGGGVLTPATLGEQYVERVKGAGVKIEVGDLS